MDRLGAWKRQCRQRIASWQRARDWGEGEGVHLRVEAEMLYSYVRHSEEYRQLISEVSDG
jgi:hypothetical protein